MRRVIIGSTILLATACAGQSGISSTTISRSPISTTSTSLTIVLTVDGHRWPNIADHWLAAQAVGKSKTCTIDRPGASHRREQSLKGIATKPDYDRDEYPPAVCKEGGVGADVRLIPSHENRSEGSWMGEQLHSYPDGTVVEIQVIK